jgi:YesN/AraC family two-component response regulator
MKFHFVITTALVARYCIEGGMDLSDAYSLSDFYIQKADKCTRISAISDLHADMCLDYAERMRQLRKNTISSKQIALCIDYIHDNMHKRITLEDLAAYVSLNPSYLSKLFKKETGTTVSDYIRKQKLETAKNMLIYSEYRPAEIASTLAFPSQSYFTEQFRRYTGLTPATFRKENFRKTLGERKES